MEPLLPYRLRDYCEDVPNTEDGIQGLLLRVGVGQGTLGGQAESIIYSGHLVTEREGSVFEADRGRKSYPVLQMRNLRPREVSPPQRSQGQASIQTF